MKKKIFLEKQSLYWYILLFEFISIVKKIWVSGWNVVDPNPEIYANYNLFFSLPFLLTLLWGYWSPAPSSTHSQPNYNRFGGQAFTSIYSPPRCSYRLVGKATVAQLLSLAIISSILYIYVLKIVIKYMLRRYNILVNFI